MHYSVSPSPATLRDLHPTPDPALSHCRGPLRARAAPCGGQSAPPFVVCHSSAIGRSTSANGGTDPDWPMTQRRARRESHEAAVPTKACAVARREMSARAAPRTALRLRRPREFRRSMKLASAAAAPSPRFDSSAVPPQSAPRRMLTHSSRKLREAATAAASSSATEGESDARRMVVTQPSPLAEAAPPAWERLRAWCARARLRTACR
mmetsp:Transcript_50340/g.162018  ORF Transcript_50340/g.162018 Transcript_50340/m.162018 type:complete len:208 (-) Transcript_50340:270-893(-)